MINLINFEVYMKKFVFLKKKILNSIILQIHNKNILSWIINATFITYLYRRFYGKNVQCKKENDKKKIEIE